MCHSFLIVYYWNDTEFLTLPVSGVKDSVAQTVVDYLMQYTPVESGLMLFRSIPQPPGYEIRYKGEVRKPIIELSGLQLIIETLKLS